MRGKREKKSQKSDCENVVGLGVKGVRIEKSGIMVSAERCQGFAGFYNK